ncbi:MAG TPA: RNA polymerase factor sigma-54, partial [Colwellia sp.]|nr:RNA polymerase factor sigma-54 [Colwellia sp.]
DEKAQSDSASEQNNLEEAYSSSNNEEKSDQPTNDGSEEQQASIDEISTTEAMEKSDIPEELNIDTTWEESYSAGVSNTGAVSSPADDYTYQGETTDSIQDHLLW